MLYFHPGDQASEWPSGWWLGDEVGGDMVAAYVAGDSDVPPLRGWKSVDPLQKDLDILLEFLAEGFGGYIKGGGKASVKSWGWEGPYQDDLGRTFFSDRIDGLLS